MIRRRTLLKSSGLLLSGLIPHSAFSSINTTAENEKNQPFFPSAQQPLLLNFNENSLGMSPLAKKAIITSLPAACRYPDIARERLIKQIALLYQLDTENISLGNGSSEIIQAMIQTIINQAHQQNKPLQLVVPEPTFHYAECYARLFGIPVAKVALTPEMRFDLPAMQQQVSTFNGYSIVYLCNPNNPTATITPANFIEDWIMQADASNTLFIIDEAYAEFVKDTSFRSAIRLVKAGQKNVLVTRTFSKIFALAGLRIGYGIAQQYLTRLMQPFVYIDNINIAGAVAAEVSLQDRQFLQQSSQSVERARNIVYQALDELELKYLPSQTNFIFHRINGDLKDYQHRMRQYNVYVGREFPPAVSWNRLTLGTPQEMVQFVNILKTFRTRNWI